MQLVTVVSLEKHGEYDLHAQVSPSALTQHAVPLHEDPVPLPLKEQLQSLYVGVHVTFRQRQSVLSPGYFAVAQQSVLPSALVHETPFGLS